MYIGVEGVTRDILMLLNKRNSNCSNTSHTFNYHDDNHNECPRHHFHSASSRSSSQGSISGSVSRADGLLNEDYWLHGKFSLSPPLYCISKLWKCASLTKRTSKKCE